MLRGAGHVDEVWGNISLIHITEDMLERLDHIAIYCKHLVALASSRKGYLKSDNISE
jgi:hypothetical protein